MGCSTSAPKQKEDPKQTIDPYPKIKLRKQLTLSDDSFQNASDAVEEPVSPGSPNTPIVPKRKDDSEKPTPKPTRTPLKRTFSSCSVNDPSGKADSSEKTAVTTNSEVIPEEFGIYVTCKKGTKPGSPPNQDSWYIWKDNGISVYGVFDGHGRHGHDVSNFVKRHLPNLIQNDKRFRGPEQHNAVIDGFDKVTRMIVIAQAMGELDCERSGTTATIVIHDEEKGLLIVAHVGDSGAALARGPQRKAHYLTPDHKPNLPGELKRIQDNGGAIAYDGYNFRVYKEGESYPGLNMSRALGDLNGRKVGISSVPDVVQIRLSAEDCYLMLCSDGVWEWIKPQEAFDICHKSLTGGGNPAKELAVAASHAWGENVEDLVDDITCVFVDLANDRGASKPKKKSLLIRSKTTELIETHNAEVSGSTLVVGENGGEHKDSKPNMPDDGASDGIPSSRGPDKPLKMPLLLYHSIYVSNTV